jgi:hypothetical protein
MGLTNAKSGNYEVHNATVPLNDVLDLVVGSAAIPAFFPMSEINGQYYYDGGTILGVEFTKAIEQCRLIADSDEEIVVDAVYCFHNDPVDEKDVSKYSVYQMYTRSQEISDYNSDIAVYSRAKQYYPNVDFRYFISPS